MKTFLSRTDVSKEEVINALGKSAVSIFYKLVYLVLALLIGKCIQFCRMAGKEQRIV